MGQVNIEQNEIAHVLSIYLSVFMKNLTMLKVSVLLASMMTMMANAVIAPALPQINEVFGSVKGAEVLSKLLMTLPALTIAFTAPFAGRLVDKRGRLKVLTYSLILYGLAGTSGAWLNSLPAILVGRLFLGLGVAGIMTTATTLIGDYFEGEARSRFMGFQGAFLGLGGVVFITSSGYLADVHWRLPFLIYSFSLIVLLLTSVFLYEPDPKERANKGGESQSYSRKTVWVIFISGFLGMSYFYIIPIQIPFFLQQFDGVNNSMSGWAISALTLTSSMSALFYSRMKRRFSYPSIYGISFLIMATGYALVSGTNSYAQVIPVIMLLGVGTGWLMPNSSLWMMSVVPGSVRGRLIGRLTTFIFLGQFASPLFIQPLQHWFGLRGAFLFSAGTMVLFAMIFFFVLQKKETND
jgi:MFS family permease